MSDTPLAQNKVISNDSGILSGTYAYSPHPSNIHDNIKQQASNSSDSIQKILSTSIQRAKQKITMLEGRHKEERGESRQERASSKEGNGNNSAIATAMKVLQMRVYELQKLVQGSQRQKGIILKELDNITSEKKMILTNLEESNKKVSQLEHTNKTNKTQIKQLNRKLEDAATRSTDLQGKCQGLQMTIRHLENDKMQLSMSMSKRQQSSTKQSPSDKQLTMKVSQLQEKSRIIHQKQKKLQQKERKITMIQIQMKEKQARLLHEGHKIKELIDQNTKLKAQMQKTSRQLAQLKDKGTAQKESYQVYLRKINDMEQQIQKLRETTKRMEEEPQQNQQDDFDMLQDKLRQFQTKYQQLVHLYRRSEQKSKRDEKEIKILKDRSREIQDLLTDILEKIGKLPTCTKDLKYLSVKATKLMVNNAQRFITLKTPTKSRSSSLNRSISRSNSQRKNTLHSQIQNYQNSNRSNKGKSNSKQKVKLQSDSKRKSGSKTKRVIVSQSGEGIEKQITDLKKQYKRLVKQLNQTESQDIRNKLNDLAFLIQEKSEKSTKMKQTKQK